MEFYKSNYIFDYAYAYQGNTQEALKRIIEVDRGITSQPFFSF
jgi:hypothetical protein